MWIVLSIIVLLLGITLAMSFTSVQTFVAKKAVNWVNGKYETSISLERFQYVFPDQFILDEVFIPSESGDTLVYASEIDLFFGGFNSVSNTAHSRGVEVKDLKFYWTMEEGDSEFGFQKFIDKFSTGDTSTSKPFGLEISNIDIINGRFWYEDKNCSDCYRMLLQNMQIEASDFDLEGAWFSLDVDAMSLSDRYSIDIVKLKTHYELQPEYMDISGLNFTTANSSFDGDVRFEYSSMEDFTDFVNKVEIIADVESSNLWSAEIQKFGEEFPDFRRFQMKGQARGTVNDLQAEDLDVQLGTVTDFKGSLALKNTTNPDTIYIDARNISLFTRPKDVEFIYSLFTDTVLPIDVNPLGDIFLEGNYVGYLSDFKSELGLKTDIGSINIDVALQNPSDEKNISYKGKIAAREFDLGALLNDSSLGVVSTQMRLDGRGSDPTVMNTLLEGKVSRFDFNDYSYKNIDINGRIKNSRFAGKLGIDDPNLRFTFDGTASFGKDTSHYKFTANVEKADLFALNLAPDSIAVVTAEMDIDFMALNYQKWAGDIRLFNTTYENARNFYFFQDIVVHSEGLDTNRYLEVRSNIVDANLSGDYTLEGIVQSFESQISKFVKSAEPVAPPKDENFIFDITVKNTQLLTELFYPKLRIEPNSKLVGTYSSDVGEFDVNFKSPGFAWDKTQVQKIDLDYQGGVEKSQLAFEVASLKLKSGFEIDSIVLGNYYYNDSLFYDLRWILRDSVDSRANLMGYAIQIDTTTFEFGIFKSDFNVGFQQFVIRDNNRILLDTGGIHIEDLIIANEQREIYINGNISDNPNEILRLNLRGFGMELANYFIGSPSARFKGALYGDVILTQVLENPKFAADLRIDSLEMNSTPLGDFSVNSDWTVKDDTIHLSAALTTGDLTTFSGKGYYQPDSLGTIKFNFDFNRFRLAAFNPFLSGIADNIRGYASGNVSVRGNTGTPVVTGELELPNTAFTVSLLETDYNVEGTPKVEILEDKIRFPDLTLRDTKYGTETKVKGGITHKNFKKFTLDMDIEANELLVLDTDENTSDPYYGTAFVSGNIAIKGPFDEIRIIANVTSERDTEFFLPIDGATEVSKTSFVTFVDPTKQDSLEVKQQKSLNLNKGVSIDFNMNINTNADVSIIIDSDAGNVLEATGYGNIRLKMNPYQDLEMYGTYTVAEGYYNFAMPGIKRRFDVLRGGTVTWNGDPLGAIIGLTARYTTKADPSALVEQLYQGGRTLVVLDLFLSGDLFDPEISFDITAPRADGTVQSVISNQLADRDRMYQQVFSLLALNRFAPAQGSIDFSGGSSQAFAFSALATQAAGYLNQVTGEYQVSLGYQGTSDATALNQQEEVEVGVSKRFFNDRITINGSVGVAVGSRQQNQSQIAGDFEVEYNISEDGRFRAKVFNRSVQDQYNFGQQNYQQGFGVFYRMDFDTWNEFMFRLTHPIESKAIKEEEGDADILNQDVPARGGK